MIPPPAGGGAPIILSTKWLKRSERRLASLTISAPGSWPSAEGGHQQVVG